MVSQRFICPAYNKETGTSCIRPKGHDGLHLSKVKQDYWWKEDEKESI